MNRNPRHNESDVSRFEGNTRAHPGEGLPHDGYMHKTDPRANYNHRQGAAPYNNNTMGYGPPGGGDPYNNGYSAGPARYSASYDDPHRGGSAGGQYVRNVPVNGYGKY